MAKRLAEQGSQVVELSPEERRVYINAKQILSPLQLEVDAGARLLADLHNQLNGASPHQAIDFFNTFGRKLILGTTAPQAVEIYLANLKTRAGDYHFRDVKKFLTRFAKAFAGEFAPITTQQIDTWLGGLGGGACNKNNARDRVITFYNFMQKKGYLPKNIEHAAKATTVYKDPRPVITSEEEAAATALGSEIYLPEEMSLILTEPDEDILVTMEIKAFCGIRTEELVRLWWILVREDIRQINVTEAIAKVAQRTVPILPNLATRLARYPVAKKHEKISKRWKSANALYHAWERSIESKGLLYKKNAFRNSYISYRLAQTKDIKQVAYECGNSPEMIQRFYQDFVTPEQAETWFKI
ncbi:MAG TPA: hypothetical protein VFE51_11510 [Verrucomicrobiae bacterium]|nr:hypothetical protein [Verrucomicrobiae bacterium]